MKLEAIVALLAEMKHLMEAADLLEKVYLERGPYADGEITKETWNKVRDFFEFDDSE